MNYYLQFILRIISSFSAPHSFSQSVIHSIVYLYQSGLVNIYFILWNKTQYSLILLLKSFRLEPWETLWSRLLCQLDMPHFCSFYLSIFLLSGISRISGLTLYFLAPVLKSSITLRNSCVFYWNILFRSQNLSAGGVHYYWSVTMVSLFKNWFLFYSAFISKSCLEKNSKISKNLHIHIKIRSTVIVRHKFCFLNWC